MIFRRHPILIFAVVIYLIFTLGLTDVIKSKRDTSKEITNKSKNLK